MSAQKIPVTVAIPILNEAQNLESCLPLLRRFERVVVIDSGSNDASLQICRDYGVEVINFRWNGEFPKKRNWFLRNHRIDTPWVLFLDADERISDAFCDELASKLSNSAHAGYWIQYVTWFLGCPLLHGDVNRKLALIRVGAGEFEHVPESHWTPFDMELHEHPVLAGSVGAIRTCVDHFDDRGFGLWLRKHNEYSTWEARRCSALATSSDGAFQQLNRRQIRKYRSLGKFWLPWVYFIYAYVYRGGFRDGYAGFAFAVAKAFYFWTISVKIRELKFQALVEPTQANKSAHFSERPGRIK
jgi:glycosyltransferase involved in cell wall biosynthesis